MIIRSSLISKLKFSDRSFRNASPRLWNSLPTNLSSFPTPSSPTPLLFNTLSLSSSQFLSRLKTYLFSLSYPPLNSSPSSPMYGFQPISSAPLVTRMSTREYTNTIGFTGYIKHLFTYLLFTYQVWQSHSHPPVHTNCHQDKCCLVFKISQIHLEVQKADNRNHQ